MALGKSALVTGIRATKNQCEKGAIERYVCRRTNLVHIRERTSGEFRGCVGEWLDVVEYNAELGAGNTWWVESEQAETHNV